MDKQLSRRQLLGALGGAALGRAQILQPILSGGQSTYFVDAQTPGSNSNSGRNPAQAWADFTNIATVPASAIVMSKQSNGTWRQAMMGWDTTATILAPDIITKTSGPVLHWDFGDGTSADITQPNYNYGSSTRRTVRCCSYDGFAAVYWWYWPTFAKDAGIGRLYNGQLLSAFRGPQMNNCAFSGSFPFLLNSSNMDFIILNNNQFSGPFPTIASSTITQVDITTNQFSGPISIGSCPNLVTMKGDFNNFSGTLPDFSAWTSLVTIRFEQNLFSGTLPSFAACSNLQHAFFGSNQFSGSQPSFNACTALLELRTAHNSFSGSLPTMAACTNLQYLECFNNNYTGTIPDFSANTKLTNAVFGYNQGACPGGDPRNVDCPGGNGFTDVAAGSFATQKSLANLYFQMCALSQTAVNQILADCVASLSITGRVHCALNINLGTNAAPSGQGITDKATLIAAGWTVVTN